MAKKEIAQYQQFLLLQKFKSRRLQISKNRSYGKGIKCINYFVPDMNSEEENMISFN